MKKTEFIAALPVWEKGMSGEKNHSLVFTAAIPAGDDFTLRIAAHSRYQAYLDGEFLAAGPARAGHGFFRVDERTVKGSGSDRELKIITAGYNVNSYYLTDQPPFLCAEAVRDGKVIAATGKDFTARRYEEKIKKINRYSFQRPFAEGYDFGRTGEAAELEVCGEKRFIERTSPLCAYAIIDAAKTVSIGVTEPEENPRRFKDRSIRAIDDELKGYTEDELEWCPVNEAYKIRSVLSPAEGVSPEGIRLENCGTAVYDMGKITTGFAKIRFSADDAVTLYIIINEKLPDSGIPDPGRDNCANVFKAVYPKGGEYGFISFEPYSYKYIQVIALGADVTVKSVSQIRETFPEAELTGLKKMPDPELQLIYDAAKESFVQNATDIFMDCPGRERAGWLCDSFFTSRVEYSLTGKSRVEKDFLENFIMPEGGFPSIPDGMLPMCYPSDHFDGVYIHNWAMWYVLELREYFHRTGDRELIDSARDRVLSLLRFTEGYENEKGLLQCLDSWIFVEWSEANDYVLDVNYPTNMLYSVFLDAIAELYSLPELAEKAEKLRKTIVEESFNGEFFVDNAELDKNDVPVVTDNRTETCQYYAFFSGTATKETFPELFDRMMNDFGAGRDKEKTYPDIPESNAFIGNYLRLELMYRYEMYDKLLENIRAFFLPMAEKTGTLWENMSPGASCNHGFASHVIYWLNSIVK